jgi:two-component system response regulator
MIETGMDILLLEDSADDALFFRDAVENLGLGYKVQVATNGLEALLLLFGDVAGQELKIYPKLIVLDLKTPKISGLEVLKKVKSHPQARTIPVVVFSSSQEKSDRVESYRLGVNSYLVKPMEPEDFSASVGMLARYWIQLNQHPNS